MILNTNLPGFYGYYGSIFDDQDTSGEIDHINELRLENGLIELENDNLIEWDYNTYYSELNLVLTECVNDFLLDMNIVKSIEFVKLHSPKFYNYTNDIMECKANINVIEIKKYINSNLQQFEKYLIDNFKSRDGFSSFYEYDLNYWIEKMNSFKNLDHIEIYALLDFICVNECFEIADQLYNGGFYNIPYLVAENYESLISE